MGESDARTPITSREALDHAVSKALQATSIIDIHTHIYASAFKDVLLYGVDELVTYHYLIAEVCRAPGGPAPEAFFAMTKTEQADCIWQHLFVNSSPVSEACRGVLTTLTDLGIDVNTGNLKQAREYFADVTADEHIDTVFRLSNVRAAVMTNDPFDALERPVWEAGGYDDPRFVPALRIDGVLVESMWDKNWKTLQSWGYNVVQGRTQQTYKAVRAFLTDEIKRMDPAYMAVSLPDSFEYPADEFTANMIANCVLPVARDTGTPFATMIGVKRQLNPALQLAGDGVGKCDIRAVERLCAENLDIKFLVTLLSRENQHELCIAARKLPNLMPFGCWWFLNDPMTIKEMTKMRLELLGLSMIPQHSDARILDQLIYKWKHSKAIFCKVLFGKYLDLMATGWELTEEAVADDVERLLSRNFTEFVGRKIQR